MRSISITPMQLFDQDAPKTVGDWIKYCNDRKDELIGAEQGITYGRIYDRIITELAGRPLSERINGITFN